MAEKIPHWSTKLAVVTTVTLTALARFDVALARVAWELKFSAA